MTLALPRDLRAQIESHARAAYPGECCGLLEGLRDGDTAQVLALHPARNLSSRNDRFEIDPADQFAALRTARANGRAVIGCYHSHPDGAAHPSATDLAGAGEEDFLWLIAGFRLGSPVTLSAFRYSANGFRAVALVNPVGAV